MSCVWRRQIRSVRDRIFDSEKRCCFEWFMIVDKLTTSDTRHFETIVQTLSWKRIYTCNILKKNTTFMCFFKNFFSIEEKSNLFLLQKKIKQKIPQNNVFWSLINFFLHPNISYDVKTTASLKYFDNRKLIRYA